LSRAQITAAGNSIQIEREPGRLALPVIAVAGGAKVLWDGRFVIAIGDGLEGSLDLRALGGEGLAELKRMGRAVKGASALLLAPSFWRENHLLAVPTIGLWARADLEALISVRFMGLRYNSGEIGLVRRDALDAC
jgi:hypothetical protein